MTQAYATDLALFVDGSWRLGEGRDLHAVANPATGATIAELPLATTADLDAALDAAARGFTIWRATDADTRAGVLHKAAALIRERAETIALTLTMEQGKPLAEARAEVQGSAHMFDWYAEEISRIYGRVLVRPTGQRSIVVQQPIGPVAAFSPWNFPVYLMAKKLAPALAAGCSVIAKPPEETPGCTSAIIHCLADAGLPTGVAQLVFGVPDTISRHLIASPIIRGISFTGSVPVGRHLMKIASDGLKRVTMELGGHAPVLIFDDCDLERTLDMVVPQKFRNAGQVCVSPTRFYVHDNIYERFLAGFAARTRDVKTGDGLLPETKMGPLANPRRPEAIAAFVDDARTKGARVLTGGERGPTDGSGFFFEPTLLADVPDSADIMSNEPFGPIAVTARFSNVDEAIAKANRLPYGLASYVFTENGRRANLVADAIEAGMVGVNSFAVSGADTPFGGVKDSGFGSEGGTEGLQGYMATKAIHHA